MEVNKYLKSASDFVTTLESTTAWDALDAENAFIAGAEYAESHLWKNPKSEVPIDGQKILIYTTYTGAQSGRQRFLVEEMTYFEEYGFALKEASERELKLKVVAWMPIPSINVNDLGLESTGRQIVKTK